MFNDLLNKYQNLSSNSQTPSKAPLTKHETLNLSNQKQSNIRIWGDYNYVFRFNTQGESLYQTSILYADAESTTSTQRLPIPIRCKWFRIKNGDRSYAISEVSSNVYQLSAEDIGCKIRVEATPIDEDEYQGKAFGEFGPIELDPSAR